MKLDRLLLRDFRNYYQLELPLGAPWVLFVGANAQGKSNLLEAIMCACAGYSPRGASDAEMIRWGQDKARVTATIASEVRGALELEVTLAAQGRRQIKINGAARNLADLAGQVGLVMFAADDLDVIKRDPSSRRRFLDTELGALSRSYYWNLVRYRRGVDQRNRLLKDIRDRGRPAAQLASWDEQLVTTGAVVVEKRATFLRSLAERGSAAHQRLVAADQRLELRYHPALGDDSAWPRIAAAAADAPALRERVAAALSRALARGRTEDIERGMTLTGPHRDDFDILCGGVDMHRFGSQGEQRSAIIALRLGLVEVVAESVGEAPILLLDDVLSELDGERRAGLFEALTGAGQVIVTATDAETFPAGVGRAACTLTVTGGHVALAAP